MQYRSKKLLSLLLAVLMIVSLLPSAAFADEADPAISEEVVAETPVEEPVEEPAEPTETPVEPTEAPAEAPVAEPTATPVEEEPVVEPTEAPADDPVVEPTEVPVVETPVDEDEFLSVTSLEGAGAGVENPVATIDDVGYETLQAAIAAAQDNDAIVLNEDITSKFDVNGKTLTIDLNAHTLTLKVSTDQINANTTIQNGTVKIAGESGPSNGYVQLAPNKTLTFDSVTVSNDSYKSDWAVFCTLQDSVMTFKNSTITLSSDNGSGGGVFKSGSYSTRGKYVFDNTNVTLTNTVRGFISSDVEIRNGSTISITGDGTEAHANNGFNECKVSVDGENTSVTVSGLFGRGFSANLAENILTVTGGAEVSFTSCGEGAIMAKAGSTTISVDADSSLTADNIVCNGNNTVTVTCGEDSQTISADNDDCALTVANGEIEYYIAKIGTKGYETLDEAIKAAESDNTITITAAGTYTLPAFTKNLTISAAENTAVTISVNKAVALSGASVTFNNITFDYYPNQNYVGLQHTNEMTYNNCTFNGQVFLYGAKETFDNCTFNQNSADAYNVWTYGAKETIFNGCIFNSAGKCILVYNEGNGDVKGNELTITNSSLNASAAVNGKAAIEIDTSLMANGAKITVDDTTATGFGTGSVSGNNLWNNKMGSEGVNNDITVTVNGDKVLFPAAAKIGETRYETLADAVAAANSGKTVVLLKDASGAGIVIDKDVTIDFGGHTYTIINPTVGSAGTETNGFQILQGHNVVLKNGTLKTCTNSCKILVQNYTNLTLDNMTLDGTGSNQMQYVFSNNCGTIEVKGNTSITAPEGAVAIDSCDFGNYSTPTVTVDTTGTITGELELTGGTMKIEGGTFKGAIDKQSGALEISGGTFTTEIDKTWCAEGYSPVKIGDGLYGVTDTPVVQDGEAAIGNTVYATLNAAITAANGSATACNINILSNVETAPEAGSITNAMTFVNLGGYTIGGVAAETALTAALASTLKLTNMANVVYTVTVCTEEDIPVAKIGDVSYTKVADALNAATSGQTVTLVADATEADSTLVLNSGVKLDLGIYTLTAKALVGAEGSSVTGAIYGASDGYAKLKVDTLVLDETPATVNLHGTDYSLIPIYDPANSCYILSAYVPYYDANNDSCIFTTDNNTIRFDFSQVASGTVRKDILTGKYSANSNKYRIAVTLSWVNDNGTYNQTYVYKDSFVQTVSDYEATSRYYTFTLTGFDTLGLTEANMETLCVQASVITDSGVVSAISPQAN